MDIDVQRKGRVTQGDAETTQLRLLEQPATYKLVQ